MVLARFSDLLRELSRDEGMQVHRSHWIAISAVSKKEKSGQSMNLRLTTGDLVPVSRRYQQQVDENFA
jgi:DNA-binding LytR/AlgR family response regulator